MSENDKSTPVLSPDDLYRLTPPVNHKIYMIIGQVASTWSLVEHDLDRLICRLLNATPKSCVCVTSQLLGHGPRFSAIIALMIAHQFDRKLIDQADTLRNELNGPADERNRLIHDPSIVATSGSVRQIKGADRKSIKRRKTPYQLKIGITDTGGVKAAKSTLQSVIDAHRKVSNFRDLVLDAFSSSQ